MIVEEFNFPATVIEHCHDLTSGPRKQLHNLSIISIIFSVIGSRAGFHLSADK